MNVQRVREFCGLLLAGTGVAAGQVLIFTVGCRFLGIQITVLAIAYMATVIYEVVLAHRG